MTALRRLVAVWTSGMGAVVAVALVGLSAVVVGTPAWWVSLFATAIAGAVVAIVGARVLRTDAARTALAAAVCVAVVAAAGGFVGVAAHDWSQARAVSDARSRVATIGAPGTWPKPMATLISGCAAVVHSMPPVAAAGLEANAAVIAARGSNLRIGPRCHALAEFSLSGINHCVPPGALVSPRQEMIR